MITLLTALAMTGCSHQPSITTTETVSVQSQVSVSQPWTAIGKLLVTAQDAKQSLRFTWEHNLGADDIITLGDSLGIRQLVIHERDGLLLERLGDESLKPLQIQQLEGDLRALTLISPRDLARALTGETANAAAISSEVTAWQLVGGRNVPRVIRLKSPDIGVKVVISRWELSTNA